MTNSGSRTNPGVRVAVAFALLAGAAAASAATLSIADAVSVRKANFKEIGGAFKTVNDELKTGAPDINTVGPAAKDIARRAALVKDHFPAGSGPESGLKTKAKAEIWSNPTEFGKYTAALARSAKALDTAARSGDLAAMTKARDALGKTCKGCHSQFREK
ncbi:MAG: cytochrome c [Novosphingobium sp.]|nr:cytochrome c [Novosphingobium sp.]